MAGGAVLAELRAHLARTGASFVAPGSVIRTGPGSLPVRWILHAVAIDGFYASSVELVRGLLVEVLRQAAALDARTVALPALATGYGPLSCEDFAQGLAAALDESPLGDLELRVVLWRERDVAPVRRARADLLSVAQSLRT